MTEVLGSILTAGILFAEFFGFPLYFNANIANFV